MEEKFKIQATDAIITITNNREEGRHIENM